MVLQNEHVPRWAAKIEWRQREPNVAIAHMILKALDDIKKGDDNAKPVLKLASLWWPEWMKKTQTLYDVYTLCHGEPDSSEYHTQRAQTIALSHTHASTLLDLPESVMP